MIQKLKTAVLVFLGTVLVASPLVLAPATAMAASSTDPSLSNGLCQGVNFKFSQSDQQCTATDTSATGVDHIITLVINIFSLVVGIASVIMIIVGGLRYIISGGDSGNVTSAKNTILYAIIGLVVVAMAQIIVKFVLNRVNNAVGSS